ncbi:sphingolipid homeostasis protein orm1 [Vanrija albida]|uniref:Sphingolipid homeostasis protein orm1 n=1 Tax=Vanrija albida TaxID=181172 RepID=A0ABR3QEH7_9TREE
MPSATLTAPSSPGRTRSVSQPLREGVETDFFQYMALPDGQKGGNPRANFARSLSSNAVGQGSYGRSSGATLASLAVQVPRNKGRARSGSLVTVTEVGTDEPGVNDRLGNAHNPNAAWVNAPGAWVIHPVLILGAKILIDAVPGMTQDISWTIVNLGYIALSFLMFHHVTGVPFESSVSAGGAYDDLTLWEQIDSGAQYTPAKKWLTSVPIGLFLISTHYTRYDYTLFALNFAALVFVLFPKLPILHRLRFQFLDYASAGDGINTPGPSRPSSPGPRSSRF